MKQHAVITRFKPDGKYYDEVKMPVNLTHGIHSIWGAIEREQGDNVNKYILYVEVPGHIHDHPRIIMPRSENPNNAKFNELIDTVNSCATEIIEAIEKLHAGK